MKTILLLIKKYGSFNLDKEIVFNNVYNAEPTEQTYIDGTKYLEGKELEEGEFEFELYEADENFSKGKHIGNAKNSADGTFKFDNGLTYEDEGKYYYIVTEKNSGDECITFDDTIYGIAVTVTDNDEGKLVVSNREIVIIDNGSVKNTESIIFNNKFTPKPEDITVEPELEPDPVEQKNVQTGDNISLYMFTFVISVIGIIITTKFRKHYTKQ